MTEISDKYVDNQSEASISLAYNKNCHFSLMTSFVKRGPGLMRPLLILVYLFFVMSQYYTQWNESNSKFTM